ncbi:heavy metal-associated isoprenylated plant protein 9 isoform X2 [Nicotiana tabacum]|uniref:Heavy metal-associated isoprenylated plant protein 9 isoform X2 n=1 Tax=Nicotiana tabacum TaxID=4097 RepID=A0A1S3ZMT8_TOBAC|nr:PREDICTED: uncharacterized protein LOC107788531 [Nicotiana tabacum]
MSGQVCMVMRVNLDCPSCCRKMRTIILRMKEIEMHLIEKQHNRVSIFGRFDPADIAIRIRKRMKRRVEILDIQLPGEEMPHATDGPDQSIMQKPRNAEANSENDILCSQ